ncbi:hypothetical protein F4703DRAFT_1795710 [Phycomyces blakesleeanus]
MRLSRSVFIWKSKIHKWGSIDRDRFEELLIYDVTYETSPAIQDSILAIETQPCDIHNYGAKVYDSLTTDLTSSTLTIAETQLSPQMNTDAPAITVYVTNTEVGFVTEYISHFPVFTVTKSVVILETVTLKEPYIKTRYITDPPVTITKTVADQRTSTVTVPFIFTKFVSSYPVITITKYGTSPQLVTYTFYDGTYSSPIRTRPKVKGTTSFLSSPTTLLMRSSASITIVNTEISILALPNNRDAIQGKNINIDIRKEAYSKQTDIPNSSKHFIIKLKSFELVISIAAIIPQKVCVSQGQKTYCWATSDRIIDDSIKKSYITVAGLIVFGHIFLNLLSYTIRTLFRFGAKLVKACIDRYTPINQNSSPASGDQLDQLHIALVLELKPLHPCPILLMFLDFLSYFKNGNIKYIYIHLISILALEYDSFYSYSSHFKICISS